jgi:hypothetical protein
MGTPEEEEMKGSKSKQNKTFQSTKPMMGKTLRGGIK